MKQTKVFYKFIAVFLVIIMSFLAIPIQAIAQNIEIDNTNEEEILETESSEFDFIDEINTPIGQEISEGVFIVQEDISKRGHFEKHYLCSDGSYVSVSYPEAIHYLDENETWQDVDQSLTYDSSTKAYINANTDFQVSFSSEASSTDMAKMEKNGYTLSWGVQTIQSEPVDVLYAPMSRMANADPNFVLPASSVAKARVSQDDATVQINAANRLIADNDSFALPKISSQISYEDAFAGSQEISVKYTVYHNKIEEDIIIYKKGDLESVSMNMDVGMLTPIVNSNGSVDLVDANGDMQFHIGIPYMIDAEYNVCNDIQVIAVKDGSNCIITYTPNEAWFNSSDRVFPILLDPSVTTNEYASNMQDTYFEENSTADHSSEQLLYVSSNRRALIRITKLPTIEPSMPIISATLSLRFQNYISDIVTLKAGYLDWGFDFEDISYQFISQDSNLVHIKHSTAIPGDIDISFDFSSSIYHIYSDEEYCIEHGEEYRGDFVIAYESGEGTGALPPFYSTEHTTPANRPIFTVKYGYTLPEGIFNGEIYAFRNLDSFSFMSVDGNEPVNNSNVYQVWNDTSAIPTTQKFKLEYVSSTGGYILRAVASTAGSGRVLSVNRMMNNLSSNMNVRLSMYDGDISQEWLIIPNDDYSFRIVPRADMSLALTAYGYYDGTSTGTTATSEGNIFIQTFVSGKACYEWYIYDNNNNLRFPADFREDPETNYYYITNEYNGKYLHRTNSVANCQSGTVASLGINNIQWHVFNLNNGYFVIRRSDMLNYYLAPTSNENGSGVQIVYNASQTIPDNCQWVFHTASGGGVLLENKVSGYYLYAADSAANPSSVFMRPLYSVGTDDYEREVWRFIAVDRYDEVNANISFNDIVIDIDEAKYPSVNGGGADWVDPNDFTYTITSGSQYVSYNTSTHKFIGLSSGTASVTATHKITGYSATFDIKVNKNAIIIIPGIMGSELFLEDANEYFAEDMALFAQDTINDLSNYEDGYVLEDMMDYDFWDYVLNIGSISGLYNAWADSMSCDENGASKYDVYVKEYRSDDPASRSNNNCGTGNAYSYLYGELFDAFSDKYSIDLFSYDWRLSNGISASKLDDYIEHYEYDNVTLVAHSMGGLVASGYLGIGDYQRNKIDQVFYLASPLLGSPTIANIWYNEDVSFAEDAIKTYLGEDAFSKFIDVYEQLTNVLDPIQNIISNYVSIYELFPSQYYFDLTETNYILSRVTTFNWGTTVSDSEYETYEDTRNFLISYFDDFDSDLLSLAEDFWDSIFINGNHISSYVDSYYYYCVNDDRTTISHMRFHQMFYADKAIPVRLLEVANYVEDGDGLVLTSSATLAGLHPQKCIRVEDATHTSFSLLSACLIGKMLELQNN